MTPPISLPRMLLWFVASALATLLAVGLLFIAVNWHDRAPNQAALRLQQVLRDTPAVAPNDNAYVYLLGIDAASGQDPRALGRTRLAWLEQQAITDAVAQSFPPPAPAPQPERAPAYLALYASCRQLDGNCAEALEADPVQAVAWINSEQWMLDRYLALLGHDAWREARPPALNLPLAPYDWALDTQRLFFVHAWINAGKGDASAVASLLQQDMRFWRMVLAASDSFAARRTAIVALNRHLTWSSLVMRSLPPAARMAAIPPLWREELSPAERSMMRNVAVELELARRRAQDARTAHRARWWAPLSDRLFQIQHTINPHATHLLALAELFSGPYPALLTAQEQLDKTEAGDDPLVDSWLFNLAGRSLPGPNMPAITFYASRTADLETLRRAALVTALLRAGEAHASGVPMQAGLKSAAERNPYTGQPFTWDEKLQAVHFTGVSMAPYGEYLVFY